VYLPTLTADPKEQLSASVAGFLAHELLPHHRSPEASTALRHPDAGYAISIARLQIRAQDVRASPQLAGVTIVVVVMPEDAPPRAYVLKRGT
jgi:hypothetical protein